MEAAHEVPDLRGGLGDAVVVRELTSCVLLSELLIIVSI